MLDVTVLHDLTLESYYIKKNNASSLHDKLTTLQI